MSTTSITIRVPDDLLEQARITAYDDHTSVTELLIAGLRMELDRRAKKGIFISVPPNATITITAVGGSAGTASGAGAPGAVHIDITGASLPSIHGGGRGGGGNAARVTTIPQS